MTVAIEERKGGLRIVGSGGGGKGGGGSARTPREHPDSLHNTSYAAILDVIGNGEMAGPVHGPDALRDIFLNGTPIRNDDGTLNFRNVQVEYRVGTVDQEHIPGFPASANVTTVGTEVTFAQPWVQALTNPDLSAVRVSIHAPQLMRMVESGKTAGDRVGYKVDYAIDLSVGGGSYQEVVRTSLDGKTINGYTRTHRIDLPSGASNWTVRVRRITPDSTSSAINDTIFVQSYAEVIDGKFRYPMTALVGIKVDAEQFQQIPTRAYRWRGQIIRVPSNYDPQSRTYTGVWDGTFKRAWSNNPAWVYYDMLTNKLYGLGDRIDASMIDRYALYQIGAYCDQLVPDGMGGMEPRFVCNVYIQSQADALRVLNDLTSTFRGMAYWANGQVAASADMPTDPVYTYTNANVVDGRFEYTGADISTLKTVALVSWNDPTDFYRSKVEVVEDDAGILRYGIRKTNVVAFGCTSRGQAQRVGLYHLYTSRMETGGVAFSVGLDGVIPQPGSIIKIADRNRAGRPIGGRIKQATASTVTLDRDHPIKPGDTLTVNMPDGSIEARPVSLVSDRAVTVSPAFTQAPAEQSVWAVDADDLVTQYVRVISVKDEGGITFAISGVFHHPGKYDAIDHNVRLDPLPVSVVPPRTQRAPTNIQITQHHTFHQGTTRHYAEITWDAPEYAATYDVQWRRDNGDWVQVPRTGTAMVELADIYAGIYIVRVRAINALDVPSLWAYSDATELDGMIGEPPTVTHLTTTGEVMAIRLDWGYPSTPNIIERVELRASLTNDFDDSYTLGEFAYPATTYTLQNLSYSAEMWFWARLIDKNGLAGQWYPTESGAGVFGQAGQDPEAIGSYLQDYINESMLAPGLIEQLEADIGDAIVGDIVPDVEERLLGYLTGDDEGVDEGVLWYAGDDGTQDSFVGNVTTVSAYNEGDYVRAKETYLIAGRVADNAAYISRVDQITVERDLALAQSITALSAEVGINRADILAEQVARADADSALANTIDALAVQVGDNEAAIASEATARANADSALTESISIQASRTVGLLVGDEGGWYAGDDDDEETQVGTPTTTSAYGEMEYDGRRYTNQRIIETNAYISRVDKTRADGQSALAQSVETLAVQVGDNAAAIVAEQVARADADSALAQSIQTLSSTVGDDIASLEAAIQITGQAIADLDGALSSSWQVKTQVRSDGRVVQAGVALGASIDPNGTSRSEILLMADTVAFLNSLNGQLHTPFVFDVANDTAFLRSAFIQNASIGSAKLSDWLESDARGPGNVPVLRLNFRTGEIQLNAPAAGGGRMTLNNQLLQVFDANDTLRVRLGIW